MINEYRPYWTSLNNFYEFGLVVWKRAGADGCVRHWLIEREGLLNGSWLPQSHTFLHAQRGFLKAPTRRRTPAGMLIWVKHPSKTAPRCQKPVFPYFIKSMNAQLMRMRTYSHRPVIHSTFFVPTRKHSASALLPRVSFCRRNS